MKYAAIVLNALAALLLGWGAAGIYALLAQRPAQVRPAVVELKPLPPTAVTDRQQVEGTLAAIGRINAALQTMGTAGSRALVAEPAPGTPGVVGGPVMPQRTVTLLMQQGDGYVAMIDDQLVRPGARLRDGGRVIQIGPDKVVVRETTGRQTLSVPVGQLRVGTLRSADAPSATGTRQQFNATPPSLVGAP
ncbi:hypothetical protein [Acidovorax sp. FG27]|uniref:hypothetical protein n=1 Tax=Acidovorax sp. FG27 TaxID=3133652 RepID=UPI0030E75A6D